MDFNRYQKLASKTAVYPKKAKLIYPALGLANEAGEVLGVIKKQIRDNKSNFKDPAFKEKASYELGDVLWYVAKTAGDIGLSLNDIAEKNIQKLFDRKARGKLKGSGDNR